MSQELGISIIDVDRILGEAGVWSYLPSQLDAASAQPLIRDETLRVLEDYGNFDERPITVQVGKIQGAS